MFAAKILADSLSPDGVRLTTFEVTFPRIILSEFNTHRMFSRNSASSRAIPVAKMLEMVRERPYIPSVFGQNQKGMQAGASLEGEDAEKARTAWLSALNAAIAHAVALAGMGVHKQTTNRLLEPFMWHTVIVTSTEWWNFFHLRNNPQAHPDIQTIARMMQELYEKDVPTPLNYNEWHLPLVSGLEHAEFSGTPEERRVAMEEWIKISVARCARVSYLTHDGTRDIQADLDLHDKLLQSGHLSPFEHVARPAKVLVGSSVNADAQHVVWDKRGNAWCGNLRGWIQYRKLIPNEADILGAPP